MEDTQTPGQITPEKNNSVKIILALLVIVAAAIGYWQFTKSDSEKTNPGQNQESANNQGQQQVLSGNQNSAPGQNQTSPEAKVFNVDGGNFSFSLKEIRVKKGDRVRVVFKNLEGLHDWVLDEFNARTAQIQANQATEVEFVADKAGTFEYYCSVGQHRQMGMKGNFIVEE